MAEGVKVRPHPAAGSRVVIPQGEDKEARVIEGEAGSSVPRSVLNEVNKKENYGRPTQAYPEGYPLLEEIKEES